MPAVMYGERILEVVVVIEYWARLKVELEKHLPRKVDVLNYRSIAKHARNNTLSSPITLNT